jgi:hypothetical protein
VCVITTAANQRFFSGEPVRALFVEELDNALNLGHHFRANAVAGQKKEIVGRHVRLTFTDKRGLLKVRDALGKARWAGRLAGKPQD